MTQRVFLVTGATGAVGRTVCRRVAETGARLAMTARREAALNELAASLDGDEDHVMTHAADLADSRQVQRLVEAVAARWGRLDVLLNIAGGWGGGARLADLAIDDWQAMMAMNLESAFYINRAVLPYMVENGWGRIVNVGSRSAEDPRARQAHYNVSKAGVVALTQSVAADYGRRGVAANVILPSTIDTPSNRKSMPNADFDRWVTTDEIASVMLFLAGETGNAFNGAIIPVYGQA
jgi:NAD(P)-dependent dehydrogenase (short-subunit alcohol dehydrogenase family)